MRKKLELEFAYVFEDVLGWWTNLSGKLFGPYKTHAAAIAKKLSHE